MDAGLQPDNISGGVRRRLQALARGVRTFVTGGRKLRADLLLGGEVATADPSALGAPELTAQTLMTAIGAELPVPAVDPRVTRLYCLLCRGLLLLRCELAAIGAHFPAKLCCTGAAGARSPCPSCHPCRHTLPLPCPSLLRACVQCCCRPSLM